MNDTRTTTTMLRPLEFEALQSRYAKRVVARISEQTEVGAHDVAERLRFARDRALERARAQRAARAAGVSASVFVGAGTLALGGEPASSSPWWVKLASALPLLALVLGLVLIQTQHVRAQIAAAAEVDLNLLVDDLPPTAYSDPGFLEFLKGPNE